LAVLAQKQSVSTLVFLQLGNVAMPLKLANLYVICECINLYQKLSVCSRVWNHLEIIVQSYFLSEYVSNHVETLLLNVVDIKCVWGQRVILERTLCAVGERVIRVEHSFMRSQLCWLRKERVRSSRSEKLVW